MKTDLQIAQEATMIPITDIAEKAGVSADDIDAYGKYKAKINEACIKKVKNNPNGKLILVTAINPTPAGEGKTTVTIGLCEALNQLGKKAMAALREPSLGPCMGIKGGAAGGGYSQVVPMEDINLHFTGDIHAITAANNLLSALIDNHIHHGNALGIDPTNIVWKRCEDMNDRALRNIVISLGGKVNGLPREDGFNISVASEVMAILCLAEDLDDLKARLSKAVIGYDFAGQPVTAGQLKADGAMAALLKDAINPNLVQTLEHNPVLIHGGPFANIAHGCNSVRATKLALKLADYTVTEAGFGADLGAEKFFDIKCRLSGLKPDAVVLVATVRAIKYNGGVKKEDLNKENLPALEKGVKNLEKHIENLHKFGVPVIVTLNSFISDTQAETDFIKNHCEKLGASFATANVWAEGGKGGIELAKKTLEAIDKGSSDFKTLYDDNLTPLEKIEKICKEIYGADSVSVMPKAAKALANIEKFGFNNLPVCMAKTQYSLSDNPSLLGRPEGFSVTVKEIRLSAGAGFIVALLGDVMTMPGLPKTPAAQNIDIDNDGKITGLF